MILNNKILILSLILFAAVPGYTQYTLQWAQRYSPRAGVHDGNDIITDDSGNVYVTGSSAGEGSDSDYITLKYNAAGVLQWEARYNGTGNGADVANKLVRDGEGNIYVTGSSIGTASGADYVTIKYDNAGEEKWVARYNGTGNGSDSVVGIAIDADRNVYVTGTSLGTMNMDIVTVKYNSAGAEQWVKRYHEVADSVDGASGLVVDKQNNVIVVGYTVGDTSYSDIVTIKYQADGTQKWIKKYNGEINNNDYGVGIDVDDSGNVYVVGQSYASTLGDYITLKYSPSGVEQWTKRYDAYGYIDQPHAIKVDSTGNVVVTGTTLNLFGGTYYDYTTVRYSSEGGLLWKQEYDYGPADEARDVIMDRMGNVFVTGWSYDASYDIATVMYNLKGDVQSVGRYNDTANKNDFGNAIAVDNKSNVYVTGSSGNNQNNSARDIVTLKYSPAASEVQENLQRFGDILGQNYPNPFSSSTKIHLSDRGLFQVRDVLGRVVYQQKVDNYNTVVTLNGSCLANGLYHYSLSDGMKVQSRIMMVLR